MRRWFFRVFLAVTALVGMGMLLSALVLLGTPGPSGPSFSTNKNHYPGYLGQVTYYSGQGTYVHARVIGGYHTNDPHHLGFVLLAGSVLLLIPLARVVARTMGKLWSRDSGTPLPR